MNHDELQKIDPNAVLPVGFDGATCDRLNGVVQFRHDRCGEVPIESQCQFSELSKYQEQPCYLYFEIGMTWKALTSIKRYGMDHPGYVVIQNRTGRAAQVHRTEEEQKEVDKKVLHICFGVGSTTPDIVIRPGRPAVFEPGDIERMIIRCPDGNAEVSLVVFPR